jgi:GNAT superfamily N-acetyltransferase
MIVRKTFLQLTSHDHLKPAHPPEHGAALTLVRVPAPQFSRFLYASIGRPHNWSSRLSWPEERWAAHYADPHRELWVAWRDGGPIGFSELLGHDEGPDRSEVEIGYLGLFPQYRGCGLGGQLLSEVAGHGWRMPDRVPGMAPVARMHLDTRTLDSRNALPNYQARGFEVERVEVLVRPRSWFTVRRWHGNLRYALRSRTYRRAS